MTEPRGQCLDSNRRESTDLEQIHKQFSFVLLDKEASTISIEGISLSPLRKASLVILWQQSVSDSCALGVKISFDSKQIYKHALGSGSHVMLTFSIGPVYNRFMGSCINPYLSFLAPLPKLSSQAIYMSKARTTHLTDTGYGHCDIFSKSSQYLTQLANVLSPIIAASTQFKVW